MPNRYTRDELIYKALDLAELPNIKKHDLSQGGSVNSNAYSIGWLQDILDYWYHMVPFSAAVIKAPFNLTANYGMYDLPEDFIVDIRNGLIVQDVNSNVNSCVRKIRISLQKFINRQIVHQASNATTTKYYCIQGKNNNRQVLNICPVPTENKTAWLWYYQLPEPLDSDSIPIFPGDYPLIEYVNLRAQEWVGKLEPGTAKAFCDRIVAAAKVNGLMNEPEDDEIPMDDLRYIPKGASTTFAWMGPR